MRKYRVKKQFDSDGKLIGYSRPRRVEGSPILNKDEVFMYGNVDSSHLKVQKTDDDWEIVLDSDSESTQMSKDQQKANLLAELNSIKMTDLNTVAKLQPFVLKLARALKDLL